MGKWAATNYEQGPFGYPIGDEQPQAGTSGVRQVFQGGTIGWPTQVTDVSDDIGTDWDEYEMNDSNCPGCGDDDRLNATGPAILDVPQPPATTFSGPSNRVATTPVQDMPLDEILAVEPDYEPMPLCTDLVPDPSAAPDETVWCTPSPEETDPGPQARTGGTDEDWVTAIQPWCTEALSQRQWGGDRMYQCMWRLDWAHLVNLQNPSQRIDYVKYVREHEVRTTWNSTTWEARTAIHIVGGGTLATYGTSHTCQTNGTCSVTANDAHSMNVEDHPDTLVDITVNGGSITAGTKTESTLYTTFDFDHPAATSETAFEAPLTRFPVVRCDNAYNGLTNQGCAIPAAEPILNMSARNVPSHSQHILRAQQSGLPGVVNGVPLTRETDKQVIQNHRNTTCNMVRAGRPANTDCDEYPFASTKEGGNASGVVRTYDGCEVPYPNPIKVYDPANITNDGLGISMCYIDRSQNRSGGGILSWFYRKMRVSDGERFYVK
jgi:hypothetical protein